MRINRLDHLVLTVTDLDRTVEFYTAVLGMEVCTFGGGRTALHFGSCKINLHEAGNEFEPKAQRPTPGSADLCFVADDPLDDIAAELARARVPVEEGPVTRAGAQGTLTSLYVRDPDHNLIEISNCT